MRSVVKAGMMAFGFLLCVSAAASAAPINGASIGQAAGEASLIDQIQYYPPPPPPYGYRGPPPYGFRGPPPRRVCRDVERCSGFGYYRRCVIRQVCDFVRY